MLAVEDGGLIVSAGEPKGTPPLSQIPRKCHAACRFRCGEIGRGTYPAAAVLDLRNISSIAAVRDRSLHNTSAFGS